MKKERFHIEYIFDKVSRRSLWNHLTTALGLSAWFADEVIINDYLYTFKWSKEALEATVIDSKPEYIIRYRWVEVVVENAYFEFIIHTFEFTGSSALEITDFSEPGEKKDSINLWDSQVEDLKRTLGI